LSFDVTFPYIQTYGRTIDQLPGKLRYVIG